jgi:RNA polymerase sigma-70 factor (ECF subfamily)
MAGGRKFATTRWSLVLDARDDEAQNSDEALAELCESYWFPLYAFVRRQGHSPEDAADLTQAYFAKLLEKEYLQDVRPEAGRFRSFLLASLKHFLCNEWDRRQAQKRGGHVQKVSLDAQLAENRYSVEPVERLTPEDLYEQHWALTVLERALRQLAKETPESKRFRFEKLRPFLIGPETDATYQQIAEELGMSENAVKVAVHRLRRRFGVVLRQEIEHTVTEPQEVDDEIHHLLDCLS